MSEKVEKIFAAIITIILMSILVLGGMMLLIWLAIQLGLLVR